LAGRRFVCVLCADAFCFSREAVLGGFVRGEQVASEKEGPGGVTEGCVKANGMGWNGMGWDGWLLRLRATDLAGWIGPCLRVRSIFLLQRLAFGNPGVEINESTQGKGCIHYFWYAIYWNFLTEPCWTD